MSHRARQVIHILLVEDNAADVTKPADLVQFLNVVKTLEQFWFEVVQLPP